MLPGIGMFTLNEGQACDQPVAYMYGHALCPTYHGHMMMAMLCSGP